MEAYFNPNRNEGVAAALAETGHDQKAAEFVTAISLSREKQNG